MGPLASRRIPISGAAKNPTPLSPRQLWALVAAATRELVWGLRAVSGEVHQWRRLARSIPDAPIRADALESLDRKRTHADGAALFWILPRRRKRTLLRLLVAYEVMWDYLDSVSERGAQAGERNARQLYSALIHALDLDAETFDYYLYHPWGDDAGYLAELVAACRRGCRALPAYEDVRELLQRETARALVLGVNHELDPTRRDATLRRWAEQEYPGHSEASWFELASAASASLTVHAVLALASETPCPSEELERVYSAYFPWVSAIGTMLDSYVDEQEDLVHGNHIYISHYPNRADGLRRITEMVSRSTLEARRLNRGHRHAVIASCMVAMYLSKDSARADSMRADTRVMIQAGGTLALLMWPILRLWRIAYALRSA
jgi:tetraprenyl-beta-curcumene synthase